MQSCYLFACIEIKHDCMQVRVRVCVCAPVWEGGEDDHRNDNVCFLACICACGPSVDVQN